MGKIAPPKQRNSVCQQIVRCRTNLCFASLSLSSLQMDLSWLTIRLACQFLLLGKWEMNKLDCIEEVHIQDQGRKVTVVLELPPGWVLGGPSACFEMNQLRIIPFLIRTPTPQRRVNPRDSLIAIFRENPRGCLLL